MRKVEALDKLTEAGNSLRKLRCTKAVMLPSPVQAACVQGLFLRVLPKLTKEKNVHKPQRKLKNL